jgi:RND family efflux transporter MFP subunit
LARAGREHAGACLLALLGALSAAAGTGCNSAPAKSAEKKAPEVVVTTPVRCDVADYQDFTGRLDGFRSVEMRAHVSGYVVEAPFKEGDLVREGDLLFLIDPRPFRADLSLAEANLKLAQADQNLQQKNVARARSLVGGRAVSQEEYDTSVATWEKSRASAEACVATRDRAKLYLDYTRVTAPLSGRVSRRFVDPGNMATADNTMLTTIVSDDQLYAYFDVDERTYLDLVGAGAPSPGQGALLAARRLPVLLGLANEEQFSRSGVIDFVDNRVNATTGTVRMRAVFDNPNGALRAGLFVRIRLPVGAPYEALAVPDEAVLSDQGKKYVYVVDDRDEVVYRPVTPGQEVAGLRVLRDAVSEKGAVKEGVVKGDRVVIGGIQRVRPGVGVRVKSQDPPKPPESRLSKLLSRPSPPAPGRPADKPAGGSAGGDKAKGAGAPAPAGPARAGG